MRKAYPYQKKPYVVKRHKKIGSKQYDLAMVHDVKSYAKMICRMVKEECGSCKITRETLDRPGIEERKVYWIWKPKACKIKDPSWL